MATQPGQGDNAPVSFTRASASRIADAVRAVEEGNRNQGALITAPRLDASGRPVLRGTFTGSWYTGTTHSVTVFGSTNTIAVTNYTKNFWAGSTPGTATATVLYARANGTLSLVEVEMDQCHNVGGAINKIASFAEAEIQILGHDTAGCLKWYSIVTCATATT